MGFEEMKRALIKADTEVFEEFGLVFFPEVIVCWFDPYSIAPDPPKTFWRLENCWLRLHPDGKVSIETLEHSYYISSSVAERLAREEHTPLHYIEYSDIYDSKLEADLAQKPVLPIPEKIEVQGAIIPYSKPILQSLIIEAIEKFGKGKASEAKIIDYLTNSPPKGGAWFTRTVSLIEKVHNTVMIMMGKGILTYDEQTKEYTIALRETTTTLRGK